ncbi:MAG: purine-nucleoside phosphorylase [Nanoarchaeota archaeon]|nr:purine-nucleoside phosphorylase [Nanoarchaeota archaeon]MBU1854304.1 purine-nucleoside phosphorylase [Nanoarchaeota archaeon]
MDALQALVSAYEYQQNYELKVKEAADFLRPKLDDEFPIFGITLGSGLGDIANKIKSNYHAINYRNIPNFPVPTTEGHAGKMLIGTLENVPVIGLSGRKHYHEVADQPFNTGMLQVRFAVDVLAELGVRNYFATNAVGGLNLKYNVGDVMIIDSHISCFIPNPLLGRELDFKRVDNHEKVWKFQPMNDSYNLEFSNLLEKAGSKFKDHVWRGTYAALTGTTYESQAESLMLRKMGVDAVGMSIVPEVIVARNRGMNVVAMSCITNKIAKDGTNDANHEEVTQILNSDKVRNRLSNIVSNFFKLYQNRYLK